MTLPTPSDRATGCSTDGKSHLNLTRTMADVWGIKPQSMPYALPRERAEREVIADHKIPYAGKGQ